MGSLILVVEDNLNILKFVRMTLEFAGYEVITAENGMQGLEVLSKLDKVPELIISDIMMPEMNGYDFFNAVSANPKFYHIPFIFLSALDSAEDIRLGKMLGADDYLTKPINEDDLIATISGKIKRNQQNRLINQQLNENLTPIEVEENKITNKNLIVFIEVNWHDVIGANLISHYPEKFELKVSLESICHQLYDAIGTIYGQEFIKNAEGVLVTAKNYNIMAYVFFDSYPDESFRGGRMDYMFSVLAPKITYFQSLKIKKIMMELSLLYKEKKEWNIETFWNKFSDIFMNQ